MNPVIFDRKDLRQFRQRARGSGGDQSFLRRAAGEGIVSRLEDVAKGFTRGLLIGQRDFGELPKIGALVTCDYGREADVEADEEFIPFKEGSFNACVSNLTLHSVNDLPGSLLQIRNILKPGGLFICSLPGRGTLHELRECLARAEIKLRGGASPRVFPFADGQQVAALMQRARFEIPVVDSESVTVTYKDFFRLLHDLRGMGEGNILSGRDRRYPGRNLFVEAEKIYREEYAQGGEIQANFNIIYAIGWRGEA